MSSSDSVLEAWVSAAAQWSSHPVVIISLTQFWFHLNSPWSCCLTTFRNVLTLTTLKTTIIIFDRCPPNFNWFNIYNPIQQINLLSYLGAHFAINSSLWIHHDAHSVNLGDSQVHHWDLPGPLYQVTGTPAIKIFPHRSTWPSSVVQEFQELSNGSLTCRDGLGTLTAGASAAHSKTHIDKTTRQPGRSSSAHKRHRCLTSKTEMGARKPSQPLLMTRRCIH